ncbi:MAG: hypothetical protein ABL921_35720, partial [Pirellula sp.]
MRSPFRARNSQVSTHGPEDFDVEIYAPEIANAKEAFNKMIDVLFSNWKAKITGNLAGGRHHNEASIKVEFKAGYPDFQPKEIFQDYVPIPINRIEDEERQSYVDEAAFEILIFNLVGHQGGGLHVGDLRTYLSKFGNVSIYDAGFRLPYYGASQDWLGIEADHARRKAISDLLPPELRIDSNYMHDLPEVRRIFGVVEINTGHERNAAASRIGNPGDLLQLSPGRDRLHSNVAYDQLRNFVRYSLDYYANRYSVRKARGIDQRRSKEPASEKQERALAILSENEQSIPPTVFRAVKREVSDALIVSRLEEDALDRRAALLAPLASAGMVALALNHELSRERHLLERSISSLRNIAKKHNLPELDIVVREFQETTGRLSSLQQLFAPLLSESDIQATDRLRVLPIASHVVTAFQPLMSGLAFDISGIPKDLRFPVGGFAEWSALVQNVVANAWNATLTS